MPRGDGTGPTGMGPMTGRAAGFCAGSEVPGYANPAPGRGCGFWGAGRGRRNRFYATGLPGWVRAGYAPPTPAPEQEAGVLKAQAEGLRKALERIEQRLQELGRSDG